MEKEEFDKLVETNDIDSLIGILYDKNSNLRKFAIRALRELNSKKASEVFIKCLNDSENYVRYQSIQALGDLKEQTAIEELINLLKNDFAPIRWNAAESLGKIGNPRAIEPLISTLQDENIEVCKKAAEALEGFNENKSIEALKIYKQTNLEQTNSKQTNSKQTKESKNIILGFFINSLRNAFLLAVALLIIFVVFKGWSISEVLAKMINNGEGILVLIALGAAGEIFRRFKV